MSYLKTHEVQERSIIVIDYLSSKAQSELFFIHKIRQSSLNEGITEIVGQNISCILRTPAAYYPFTSKNTKVFKMSELGTKMIQSGVRGYRKMNQKESRDLARVFEHLKDNLPNKIKDLYELLEQAVFQKLENNTKVRISSPPQNARVSSARG